MENNIKSNSIVNVNIELCREGAVLPQYKNDGDAGMDVYALEDIVLNQGETKIISTGLKFAIPKGYEIQVRPRSGISFNTPLRISNSPGTIDSGYRDELGIIVTNTSNIDLDDTELYPLSTKGNKQGRYIIKKYDRIAQIVLCEVPKIVFNVVEDVNKIGENRGGGFGSTGV
jgi:dUTP pyrophosphatase